MLNSRLIFSPRFCCFLKCRTEYVVCVKTHTDWASMYRQETIFIQLNLIWWVNRDFVLSIFVMFANLISCFRPVSSLLLFRLIFFCRFRFEIGQDSERFSASRNVALHQSLMAQQIKSEGTSSILTRYFIPSCSFFISFLFDF